jgi:hypothetical protein
MKFGRREGKAQMAVLRTTFKGAQRRAFPAKSLTINEKKSKFHSLFLLLELQCAGEFKRNSLKRLKQSRLKS